MLALIYPFKPQSILINTFEQSFLLCVCILGESVDMLDSFSRMTLEVILSTAFGVETDIQNDKESLLFKKVKEVFRTPWIMDILRRFPFGIYLMRILAQIMRTPSYFEKVASEILRQRRKTGPTGRQDLMHLMLTANEDSTENG